MVMNRNSQVLWKDTWDLSTIPVIYPCGPVSILENFERVIIMIGQTRAGKNTFHKRSCLFCSKILMYTFLVLLRHYRIMDWCFVFVLVIGLFVFENTHINFLFLLVWYKWCLTLEIIINVSKNIYLMPWETSVVLSLLISYFQPIFFCIKSSS